MNEQTNDENVDISLSRDQWATLLNCINETREAVLPENLRARVGADPRQLAALRAYIVAVVRDASAVDQSGRAV